MNDDQTSCSTAKCGKKKWRTLMFGVVLGIYAQLFDFLVNGVLFADLYKQNAAHFRPEQDMQVFIPYCILYHLAMGILVAKGYVKWRKKAPFPAGSCPIQKSLGYGMWVGLLLGIPQIMVAVWTTIPAMLPLIWFGGELVKWTLSGVLLAKLYGKETV